ncbi:response regulator [Rhizobium sp. 1399]|jgi:DNA-binding NtrC family response regulator|uniref:response regulator n=1 Tax=Rhizobium sp. 1399 TaxID=2817758 RepID=UPI002863BB76|nr:response regulator [Rhizobium sp. 1399]MDR6667890.1 DNA-binding NtrC family response regulator [Rhizobium sp. 1399]
MGSGSLHLLRGKRILIVEHEYFVPDETRMALERAGATVIGPAPSVEIGLALIEEYVVEGAILDIRLEGQTVFPIAERLQDTGIPFVFATAYLGSGVPEHYGGYYLAGKPNALEEIASALFDPSPRIQ